MSDLREALAAIVGAAHVLAEPDDVARYDDDGRGPGGAARIVVRPHSAEQVSAVVRTAHGRAARLVPQGGRSGLSGAGLAARGADIILSLDRLTHNLVIDPANRSAEVDAGVSLSALNAAAAQHGLFFPIDLGADPTIGGMIAANTGGARFLRYGDVRRNLLGLEAVLGDNEGTMVRFGHGLWKDNSALDLKQLLASSSGAMGIVTRATIALQPLPTHRVTALVALADPDVALALLLDLERRAGTLLSAFEGISSVALDLACTHVPRLSAPFAGTQPAYCTLVELSGGNGIPLDLLQDILGEAIAPLFEQGMAIDAAIDTGDRLWTIRHAIPEGLRAAGTVIACDIAVRRGDLMRFRAAAAALVAARWPSLIIADFGHAGDGGLHFNMVWPRTAGPIPSDLAASVQTAIFDLVVDGFGGSFSAEHGIGPRNVHHYARLVAEPVRQLSGRIQRLMAPAGIGRVDFGAGSKEQQCPMP